MSLHKYDALPRGKQNLDKYNPKRKYTNTGPSLGKEKWGIKNIGSLKTSQSDKQRQEQQFLIILSERYLFYIKWYKVSK